MKTKHVSRILVALVLMLAISLAGTAVAAPEDKTTKATVAFTPGDLSWDDSHVDFTDMNIPFGTHELPAGDSFYKSQASKPHRLAVKDAQKVPTTWEVKVSMTKFNETDATGGSSSFGATILLLSPTQSHISPQMVTYPQLAIISEEAETAVMSNTVPERNLFYAVWVQDNVRLNISAQQAKDAIDVAYEAELTWMLAVGP